MISIQANNITDLYINALEALKEHGTKIPSRVGETIEIMNFSSNLKDPQSRLILDPLRKHNLDYIKKEFVWYMNKDPSIEYIRKASKFWDNVTDDGCTVNSNYGAKIFKPILQDGIDNDWYKKTQYDFVKEELERNPNSRRAVWFYIDENDYKKMHTTKDFPCTQLSQFYVRDGKLNQTVYIRSNDLVFGWCNDMPFYSMMQEMLATDLNLKLGELQHVAGSMHIYDRHYKLLESAGKETPQLTKSTIDYIESQIPFEPMTIDDVNYLKNMPTKELAPSTAFMKELFRYDKP